MNKSPHEPRNPIPQNRVKGTTRPDGRVRSKTPYVDDKLHGLYIWHLKDGTKKWEQMWRDGEKHGRETDWWDNGRKRRQLIRWNYDLQGVTTIWGRMARKKRKYITPMMKKLEG